MRTTVSLPTPLLKNAKQCAAQRGVTLSTLVEDAVRCLLAQSPSSSVSAFRLHTVRGKLVDRTLDLDRTSALIVMEDEASFRRQSR